MYAPCYADFVTTFDTMEYSLLWRIAFVVPVLLTGACTLGFIAALANSKTAFKNLAVFLTIYLGVLQFIKSILEVTNLLKTVEQPSFLLYLYIPTSSLSLCSNALLLIYAYKQSRPLIGKNLLINGALITLSFAILVFQTYFRCFAVISPYESDQHMWLRTYQLIHLCCFLVIDGVYCLVFIHGIRRSLYINAVVGPAPLYVDKDVYRVYKSSSIRFLCATLLGVVQHALLVASAEPSPATLYVSVAVGQLRIMVYMLDSCAMELVKSEKTHLFDLWIRRSAVIRSQRHSKRKATSVMVKMAESCQEQSFSSLKFSFEDRDVEIDQRSLQLLNALTPPPRWPSNAALRNIGPPLNDQPYLRQYSSPGSLILRRDVPTPSTYDTFGKSSKPTGTMPFI